MWAVVDDQLNKELEKEQRINAQQDKNWRSGAIKVTVGLNTGRSKRSTHWQNRTF